VIGRGCIFVKNELLKVKGFDLWGGAPPKKLYLVSPPPPPPGI